jgi:hypothetical protein
LKSHGTLTKKKMMMTSIDKYILDCIELPGTDLEKVNALYEQFKSEMVYEKTKPISGFEQYIRGMPQGFNIAHYYHEIDNVCAILKYNVEPSMWFTRIASLFFSLRERLNNHHKKTKRLPNATHSFVVDFFIDSEREFTAIAICDMITRCLDHNGFSDIKDISVTMLPQYECEICGSVSSVDTTLPCSGCVSQYNLNGEES